jgi:antirestriction protein ArdC
LSNQTTGSDPESRLRELHDHLIRSVEELITGDDWKRALEFAASFRSRSFNNTLLIYAQHAEAYERGLVEVALPSYVAGFKQWQGLGRHVRAGQKGYAIFAPVTARFASRFPTEVDSWRRLARSERPRAGDVVRSQMVGVRPAYVWDVSQTDGPPVPELPMPSLLSGEAPSGMRDGLTTLIEAAGFRILHTPDAASLGGANGRTDFGGLTVAVRADMDPAAQVKTLAHELAHIQMHGPEGDASSHRGVSEIEAESVALMVGAAHGMDTSDYTIPYVSTWATSVKGRTVTEVVRDTGERVRRAAVMILGHLDTAQIRLGEPPVPDGLMPSRPSAGNEPGPPDRLEMGHEGRSL